MKTKHIVLLIGIMVILLSALFLKKVLIKPEIEITEYKNLGISIEPSNISAIEIKNAKDGSSLMMERKGETEWYIPAMWNMKAKEQKIDDLLKNLAELQGELRSNSVELLSDYGISDNEAFAIVIYDKNKKPQQSVIIGKEKPGYGNSFLRKSDSAEVYLVNKDILSLIGVRGAPKETNINVDAWMDLSVIKFDVDKIESVKIVRAEQGNDITTVDMKKGLDGQKNLKQWVSVGKKPIFDIDAKKIKDFLKKVNDMYAIKAVDPAGKDYGFDSPLLTVILDGQEKPIELILGNIVQGNGEDRYITTSEGYVYVIPKYRVESMNIDISRFFIDNPLRIDKDKLESVNVKSENIAVALDKNLIDKNINYIDKLKAFSVEKMFLGTKYSGGLKIPIKYSIEVKQADSGIVVDIEKDEEANIFVAQVHGEPDIFTIDKGVFENIFVGLDKLDLTVDKKEESPESSKQLPVTSEQ